MSFSKLEVILSALLAIALWGGNAFGQAQDGNLVGSILDPTGAAVANAKVEAENAATGVKAAATTDGEAAAEVEKDVPDG